MTAADLWADPTDLDARQAAYEQGRADGYRAGLDARPPATVWAPHQTRWRHARPGDAFTGRGGELWHLTAVTARAGMLDVHAVQGERVAPVTVDPDEAVTLLAPVDERDAIELTAQLLGARITDRHLDAPGPGG